MAAGGKRPTAYRGPRSPVERYLCQRLFGVMIQTDLVQLQMDDDAEPSAPFVVAPPDLWTTVRIITDPGFWVGESYVAGRWYLRRGALADFLDTIQREAPRRFASYYRLVHRLRRWHHLLGQHLVNRSYTRQVKSHYDVDPILYGYILDDELVYTCGFFDAAHTSLSEAQQNKLQITLSRLALNGQRARVLDIGCGWGAAERAFVRQYQDGEICGLSISTGQIAWAKAKDEGSLTASDRERVEYRHEDYAQHDRPGYYDAVFAIGMIEHVGLGGYRQFFQQVGRLLAPGGTGLVHSILAPVSDIPSNRWIDRYIFRGGYAPSLAELTHAIESQPLRVTAIHLHEPSNYRTTLQSWIDNFHANLERLTGYLQGKGFGVARVEATIRTWEFYLSSVRNMFDPRAAHTHQTVQICFSKPKTSK
jgi:cyclopropane-fatty-acyl-phospholipid synthase